MSRGPRSGRPIPLPGEGVGDYTERFWAKVERIGECLEWTGTRLRGGYGQFSIKGRGYPAHRVAYEMSRGRIPSGLVLDHLCGNPRCVRIDHLEAVEQAENVARGNLS